ncbi:MAG: DUF4232 domain-containing protein [Acidimicrobiales bacterium]|jgi:hypothetical protein
MRPDPNARFDTRRDRTRSGHRLWPILAVGALAVGITACGSSSSSSSTSTTRTSTTTTTVAPSSTTSTTAASSSSSSTTTTSTTLTTSIGGCRTSALVISIGAPNGTAGAIHYGITFHNTGSTACTLYGFPGVSFLAASGSQIGAPAQRENLTPVKVTLAAGASAYASVAVTDPGIPPCSGSATATEVRVYPPGQTQAATVAAPSGLSVCSSPNTANYSSATVTTVVATPL